MGIFKKTRNALIDRALSTNTGRKAAMRAAATMGNGIVYRNLGDHRLVVDSSELIGRSVLARGHFTRDMLDATIAQLAAEDRLTPQGTFIDVGANIGTHTVYANLTGRFGHFVCLEPDPRTFELLSANVALNKLADRTTLLHMGAGDAEATLQLYRVPENSGASALVAASQLAKPTAIPVKVRRLDDILDNAHVAFERTGLVWMDTEGFEPQIWAGMPRLLSGRPNIVIEYSPRLYGDAATKTFRAALLGQYPRVRAFANGRWRDIQTSEIAAVTDQIDLLLTA